MNAWLQPFPELSLQCSINFISRFQDLTWASFDHQTLVGVAACGLRLK